jgi:hypothetical protein
VICMGVLYFVTSWIAVKSEVGRSFVSVLKTNHNSHAGLDHCTSILRTVDVPKHVIEFYLVV